MPIKGACGSCTRPDSAEDMVQCDKCEVWHHFSCGGVDMSVTDLHWECRKCTKGRSAVVIEGTSAGSSSSPTTTTVASGLLAMMNTANDGVLTAKTTPADMADFTTRTTSKEKAANACNSTGKHSLKMKLEMLEEQRKMEMKFLEQKYALLALEDADSSNDFEDISPKVGIIQEKVSENEFFDRVNVGMNSQSQLDSKNVVRSLTSDNIACRQALSKELPTFSGRPEEWAIFYSSFQHSTELCRYTDTENLIRLQRALKGDALKSVGSMLLLPSSVPEVMKMLKWLYGRPELIIEGLIKKVRSEPPPKADKFESLVGFALSIKQLYATMIAAGLEDHINNPTLLQELVNKLPPMLRLNWAMHSASLAKRSLQEFSVWVGSMAEAANTLVTPGADSRPDRRMGHLNAHSDHRTTQSRSRATNCFACRQDHRIVDCNTFKDFSISRRWNIVRENNICEKCLKHFKRSRCTSNLTCGVNGCNQNHNALLHNDFNNASTSTGGVYNACQENDSGDVLFKVIPVTVYGRARSVNTYAFLDSGSSVTLVEKSLANSLELEGVRNPLCLKWTADVARWEHNSCVVPLEISAVNETNKLYRMVDVRTVEYLGLPRQTFNAYHAQRKYKHLRGLPLPSYQEVQPRLLIGLKNENLAVALNIREGRCNEPVALKTRLGWLVCGGQGMSPSRSYSVYHHVSVCECDQQLHDQINKFLALEDRISGKDYMETAEEKRAKLLLQAMTRRVGDRYESGLLWKYEKVNLPNSYPMALKRLECLERRVKVDPELLVKLNSQINQLVAKGYAKRLSSKELQVAHQRTWYLPIFIVKNPNKPDKVRLVWDAAAKVAGLSLNEMLLKGPDQLTSLPDVLYAFRSRRIAICGDIAEMFHQVRVREEDRHVQRFLWRNGNSKLAPDVYEMEVLTFGASCSPSVAQFVMNANARQFNDKYPRAVMAIEEHHYVDDLMDSVDTIKEAVQSAQEVRQIHAYGGFTIRNWLSNSRRVLEELGQLSSEEGKVIAFTDDEASVAKVLGIWWKRGSDIFTFSLRFARLQEDILLGTRISTKRELLRLLMSIFDPLGFLAHYLVKLKILLQEVWRQTVDWDEVIPEHLHNLWKEWLMLLPRVQDVEIPRCYSTMTIGKETSIELHVFVDASEEAMAAVAYFRFCDGDIVNVNIVSAKTKVSPRIPISIPRMELHAAVMGARLAACITQGHKFKITRKVLWSDSRTVHSWLQSDARRYNQFVMYRIGEILEKTKIDEWRWVPSRLNVADDATKWNKAPAFGNDDRWFKGPEFLYQSEEQWPMKQLSNEEQRDELRPKYLLTHRVHKEPLLEFSRFSSWLRLLRTVGWMLRGASNFKCLLANEPKRLGSLSSDELQRARSYLVKTAQEEMYADEIAVLKNNGCLKKTSTLATCSPYLDGTGILRMKGRIDRASCIDEQSKRPILMPREHPVTDLLVSYWHELYHHCCHSTVINEIRQRYWIPRLRSKLQFIRRRCQQCRLRKAQPQNPEMAALPAARLAAYTRPFSYVGVDYFGPMNVTVGRRTEKRWGVLFTCMTIRAVHLEVAYSLSTDSCIICIRNFMARRGTPVEFYSDNGTNFRGAETELREAFALIDKSSIEERFNTTETSWRFNPPSAPHMGGSWERLVGSVKKILKEVTRNQRLQDESLHAFLLEAESIVNSRPLTYVSLEDCDAEALTPNHFLLGSSSGSKLPGTFNDKDLMLRKNWRKCQQLADMFWRRWVDEYLPTLTGRTKWFTPAKPIKEGDLVVVVDNNLPRGSWPKGVIIAVNTAKDGQVRSATVRTLSGVYTRPVTKLAILDVNNNKESETAEDQQHH